jgi:hypothetical protein
LLLVSGDDSFSGGADDWAADFSQGQIRLDLFGGCLCLGMVAGKFWGGRTPHTHLNFRRYAGTLEPEPGAAASILT